MGRSEVVSAVSSQDEPPGDTPRGEQRSCGGGSASQRGNRSVSNTHALTRFHRTLLASVLIYSFCEIV